MTDLLKIIVPAIIILLLAFTGLAIKVLFRKNGSFPNTHIHGNKLMEKNNIHCVRKEDLLEQSKSWQREKFRNLKYLKK